ncbi:PaaI family thioesterase [Pseudorhodoferax sp. Leaf267]|uniref:PaaI family thioesterase n=1 Tax=Pseudorhodoferax sp. Leaf267 TaxID=1736316 RepID=UPI000700A8FE|nr:PaaI family thioesterase [Pseudorhodoferax sp. Leaf267]KQP14209.1 phenylacetic acid degradation protein [Pseudorhodoferax sp. Leaf267]
MAHDSDAIAPSALFQRVQTSLERQGMMRHLGARLLRVEPGLCEIALPFSDRVTQQQGSFHGGAMGALADIAGGYAALTVVPAGMEVVTVEYKINFLAARQGGELRATGRVVRAGQRVIVTTAEVLHLAEDGRETACAVSQQTLAPVPMQY